MREFRTPDIVFNCKFCGEIIKFTDKLHYSYHRDCANKARMEYWELKGHDTIGHYKRTCQDCGIVFCAGKRDTNFCTEKCTMEYYKVEKLFSCPECGQDFKPARTDSKYCSGKCRQAAYRKRVTDRQGNL